MNKVALIVVYIGKFPNYFDLWEKSAGANPNFHFHIFCDYPRMAKYTNIFYHKINLDEFKNKIEHLLDMKVELSKPYKLCDFRPTYGLVFEEYLHDYTHWGYCDLDLIFGNISKFVTNDILDKYDKIYRHGHFTIFKNNQRMNNIFKVDNNSTLYTYKTAFSTSIACNFDENEGVSTIAENEKDVKCYKSLDFVDVASDYFRFKSWGKHKTNKQIYSWENGKLYCNYIENGKLEKEQIMYAHLQKREMQISPDLNLTDEKFIIVPNKFEKYQNIDKNFVEKNSKNKPYWKWWIKRLKISLKKFNKETIKQKLFRIKRKKYLEKTFNKEIKL